MNKSFEERTAFTVVTPDPNLNCFLKLVEKWDSNAESRHIRYSLKIWDVIFLAGNFSGTGSIGLEEYASNT